MKYSIITGATEHTKLSRTVTWQDIRRALDDGIKHHMAGVCIPPVYVERAREYVGNAVAIGTVIGFPNGYGTTASKCKEAVDALRAGASEIDVVIQHGWLREQRYDDVLQEMQALREMAEGCICKFVVESSLLSETEKIKLCELAVRAKADYIVTATGFAGGGEPARELMLYTQYCGPSVGIKVVGGIATLDDAKRLLDLGAVRLGTGRIVDILNQLQPESR